MKRLLILLTVGGLSLAGTALRAEEPPYLEFVRGLRQRGMPDYALEYLQELNKNPPASLKRVLPLELAKARADLAQIEPDLTRREAMYEQARQELEAFLKANPKAPEVADTTLELGRTISRLGQLAVLQADRQDQAEARKTGMNRARELFALAGKQLEAAAGLIGQRLANKELPEAEKTSLQTLRDQLELERGINSLRQYMAGTDLDIKDGPEIAKKTQDILKKVGHDDKKSSLYWVGRAWLGRYYYESQDYRSCRTELDKIIKNKESAAAEGQRLARYFQIIMMDRDPDASAKKDLIAAKRKAAEEWLRDYARYRTTPEGYGVQFQFADALLNDAMRQAKNAQATPYVQKLYKDAEAYFAVVERAENEYSRQAHDRRLTSILTRSGELSRGDIGRLKDFQECYLRAQLELWQMGEDERKPPKNIKPEGLKKKRAKHLADSVAALNRALELADPQTPAKDLVEARYYLGYLYLRELNDPYRGAIVGESLARTVPQSSRAVAAAAYALQAYAEILGEDEGNDALPANCVEADRRRVQDLAVYMEKTWPADPVAAIARHQLGAMAFRAKQYPQAIHYLSQINPAYPGYTASQYMLAIAALQAQKNGATPAKGQPSFADQAIAALRKIPDLSPSAEASTTQFYFLGKVQLASLLFSTRKYDEMAKLATQIVKHYETAKGKIADEVKKELEPSLKVLPVYAQFGQADADFRAGKVAEARKVIDPLIDQVRQGKLPDLKDPVMIRTMMGLGLRASVLDGDTKHAHEILTSLMEQKSESALEGTSAILGDLVQQLRGQLDELRQKGKEGEKDLEKTVKSFTAFLDEMAKLPADKVTSDLLAFLARGYASLDKHKEAAELLNRITPPKPAAEQTQVEPEKVASYHYLQLMQIREYRLAKQYDQAREKLKGLLTSPWGKNKPEVKAELNSLWEDEGKYAAAGKGWNDLMTTLRPSIDKYPRYKDLYFECYYHLVYCMYHNAQGMADKNKKAENVRRAANLIVNLKRNKPDMGGDLLKKQYDELLGKEAPLKKAFDSLEKSAQ
jgi:hypothetical protein